MADLPKNISLVSYKNKKDGSKQLKYRVRLQVDGENINRLFDELPDAKAFLLEARSTYGRKALSEQENAEKKALDEYRKPTFDWFLDVYFEKKYPEKNYRSSTLKLKQYRTYQSFFRTIKNTSVATFNERLLRGPTGISTQPIVCRFAGATRLRNGSAHHPPCAASGRRPISSLR